MSLQPAILLPVPRVARYLSFSVRFGNAPATAMDALRALLVDDRSVVGIGLPLVAHWEAAVDGLRTFPALSGPGVQIPSTQQALWCWLRDEDRGALVQRTRALCESLDEAFRLEQVVDAFKHGQGELGLDLTGYEDGTENPSGDDAITTAMVKDRGPGLDGSSFVAVQQWVHDLKTFGSLPQREQDRTIGRQRSDNAELDDPPKSAHTKRTEQESFEPEAFVWRRSMSWAEEGGEGMIFVAFGHDFRAFEAQLRRMVGLQDGVPDALFRFTHPISGGYYWCPPVRDGRLDLDAVSPGSRPVRSLEPSLTSGGTR